MLVFSAQKFEVKGVFYMKLGKTNLEIGRQGLGCMSMSEFYGKPVDDSAGIQLIKTAYHNGINFLDTADIYGYGRNELLVGKAIAELINEGIKRSQIILASKCGIIRDENDPTKRGVSNSYDYVKTSCEASLQRLGKNTGYIDLYYLHRISNNGAEIDEAMRAMSELLQAGKIKAVGLSEAKPDVIHAANKALLKYTQGAHQLAAIQSEYSLMTRVVETDGVLEACQQLGITFVAYSPLSRALLANSIQDPTQELAADDYRRSLPRFQKDNLEKNQFIVNIVKAIAEEQQCTPAQVALAWVIHKNVVPIPGTTKAKNLLANCAAENIQLTAGQLAQLDELSTAHGYRYTDEAMKAYGMEDEMN
jgi:aryl-alcohol dehydrogenase-like predicted oxidoreductase